MPVLPKLDDPMIMDLKNLPTSELTRQLFGQNRTVASDLIYNELRARKRDGGDLFGASTVLFDELQKSNDLPYVCFGILNAARPDGWFDFVDQQIDCLTNTQPKRRLQAIELLTKLSRFDQFHGGIGSQRKMLDNLRTIKSEAAIIASLEHEDRKVAKVAADLIRFGIRSFLDVPGTLAELAPRLAGIHGSEVLQGVLLAIKAGHSAYSIIPKVEKLNPCLEADRVIVADALQNSDHETVQKIFSNSQQQAKLFFPLCDTFDQLPRESCYSLLRLAASSLDVRCRLYVSQAYWDRAKLGDDLTNHLGVLDALFTDSDQSKKNSPAIRAALALMWQGMRFDPAMVTPILSKGLKRKPAMVEAATSALTWIAFSTNNWEQIKSLPRNKAAIKGIEEAGSDCRLRREPCQLLTEDFSVPDWLFQLGKKG